MRNSLKVWRRIGINLVRASVLLGGTITALGVSIVSPLYVGIKIVVLTESLWLSSIGGFLIFWGAVYLSTQILRYTKKANLSLERLTQ